MRTKVGSCKWAHRLTPKVLDSSILETAKLEVERLQLETVNRADVLPPISVILSWFHSCSVHASSSRVLSNVEDVVVSQLKSIRLSVHYVEHMLAHGTTAAGE